jgi:hypothetical protein
VFFIASGRATVHVERNATAPQATTLAVPQAAAGENAAAAGVQVQQLAGRGEVFTIAELAPGQLVGEMAFVTSGKASATVVALNDMKVLVWNRSSLESVFQKHPSLAGLIIRYISQDLVEKMLLATRTSSGSGGSSALATRPPSSGSSERSEKG